MIEEIEIYSGGVSLAKYSGEYLNCMKERDFSTEKKELWNRMTGNIPELYDPANANGYVNNYPNSLFTQDGLIQSRLLEEENYIPIDAFSVIAVKWLFH